MGLIARPQGTFYGPTAGRDSERTTMAVVAEANDLADRFLRMAVNGRPLNGPVMQLASGELVGGSEYSAEVASFPEDWFNHKPTGIFCPACDLDKKKSGHKKGTEHGQAREGKRHPMARWPMAGIGHWGAVRIERARARAPQLRCWLRSHSRPAAARSGVCGGGFRSRWALFCSFLLKHTKRAFTPPLAPIRARLS